MTFKSFLAEATILEGGAAIKGSHQLTQAEAREIISAVIHDLKLMLKLPSNKIATVGSAGLKPGDQLSGDIDIAVEADVTAVKKAVEELALDGRFKHMPGLNVYSYAKLHGSKVAQVDIIPTTNIKLAKWAYFNDPGDMKLGLKGSHRNELLFAIAKFAELISKGKDKDGADSARERLVFDLSRGLYRYTQDRSGKRGLKKSFSTVSKELVTSDPDQICERLFGPGITASRVMTFHDALKLMLAPSFKHKAKLKEIIDRAISGLEGKKLVVPHELRVAIINESLERGAFLELQQKLIDDLPDNYSVELIKSERYKRLGLKLSVLDKAQVEHKLFTIFHSVRGGNLYNIRDARVADMKDYPYHLLLAKAKIEAQTEVTAQDLTEAPNSILRGTLLMLQQLAHDKLNVPGFEDELETSLHMTNGELELHIDFPEHYGVKVNIFDLRNSKIVLGLVVKVDLIDCNEQVTFSMRQWPDGDIGVITGQPRKLTTGISEHFSSTWKEAGAVLMNEINEIVKDL